MTQKNDGGQAFPARWPNEWRQTSGEISLRDYFAGQALVGMIANVSSSVCPQPGDNDAQAFARSAYIVADAMLAEREK